MKILDLDAALKEDAGAPKRKKGVPGAPGKKAGPKRPPSRAPFIWGGLALILVAGAVGWTVFRNWPEQTRFGLGQVQAVVNEEFPTTGRYLSLLDATVSNPRVGLAVGSDRIGMKFDLTLAPTEKTEKWGGGDDAARLEVSTQVDVTAGVRYVPETGSVYLGDAVVERVDVSGTPIEFQNRAPQFVAEVIESALRSRPVHTLRVEEMKTHPARLRLKSYKVRDGEVVMVLGL